MRSAFSSLRARVALLVLLAIVPLLALSVYNNLLQRRLAGERAGERALQLVRLAVGNEEEIVEGSRQLLIALSQLSEVRGDNPTACNVLLARIRDQNRRYANLGVIAPDGAVFCSALPFSEDVRLDDRTYFRQAFEERAFSVGDYQIGRITGQPTINFGYPVIGENGDVSAVVFAALDLSWLNQLAAEQVLEEGVVLFSVDRRGAILTHFPDGERWVGQAMPEAPLIRAVLSSGGEGTLEIAGLDGVTRLYAHAPLDPERNTGVYIGAGIPASAAYVEANRDLARNLRTLGFLTLLFLTLAWTFADRFVLRPVQDLTRASQRLSGGDLSARTGLSYDGSEVGRLAHTFDHMASSLESRVQRLQALNTIDRAITARYDLPETLAVVLEQVVDGLHVDAAAILLLNEEDGTLEVAATRGFRNEDPTGQRLPVEESLSGWLVQERRSIFIADVGTRDELDALLMPGEGFAAYGGVALFSEGQLLGVLGVYHRRPLVLEDEWKSFLEALALQASIAIDNTRLLQETRRLLQMTRQQTRQMQQIVDTLPEGVALLNLERRILMTNPLGSRYLSELAGAETGDALQALAGRPLDDFLRPVGEDEPWYELSLAEEGQVFELASQPVRRDGGVAGWVLVLRNVTEERERQEYLGAQGRLATVGQLAAGIAHDFNNIMSIILLYGQALSRRPDHPRHEEYLETIVSQAQRASKLITQILDFSRAGAIERKLLSLGAFVADVTSLLQRTMPESITITHQQVGDDLYVEGDATRLQQVLMNLAINARDAMPQGGRLDITLGTYSVAPGETPPLPDMQPGDYACLAVSDCGSGIAPQDLSRIFEPFFTTKPRGEGTGLGLAQVYGIVRQHEGFIGVQSRLGEGTTFTIYLPRADRHLPLDRQDPIESDSANGVQSGSPRMILLVEDNEITRAAIADTLDELGYKVLEAGNGQEALDVLQQQPAVELILCDIVMPELDGIALQRALHESHPHVALLFMSGYPLQREEARQLMRHDRFHYLKKPFSAVELAREIETVLKEGRQR